MSFLRPLFHSSPAIYAAAGGGGGGSVTFTATANPASVDSGFGSSTATFTSVSTGSTTRAGVVFATFANCSSGVSGVTYAGGACTRVGTNGTSQVAELWYRADTTNASGNVVVTSTGGFSMGECMIAAGQLVGATMAPTAHAESVWAFADWTPSSITIPASGVGLVALIDGQDPNTPDVNFTRDYRIVSTGGYGLILAHYTVAGTWSPSAVNSSSGLGGAIGAWGP